MEPTTITQPQAVCTEPSVRPGPSEPCLFLELPPEMRNMIYEMMIDSIPPANISIFPSDIKDLEEISVSRPSRAPTGSAMTREWAQLGHGFLGFSQTCKIVRKEFMPILEEYMRYRVKISDLHQWLTDVVLPTGQSGRSIDKSTYVISVDPYTAEIRDTILLLHQNRHLQLSYDAGLDDTLGRFLCSLALDTSWRLYVMHEVVKIMLWIDIKYYEERRYGNTSDGDGESSEHHFDDDGVLVERPWSHLGCPEIGLVVRAFFAEPWMFYRDIKPWPHPREVHKWRRERDVRDFWWMTVFANQFQYLDTNTRSIENRMSWRGLSVSE